MSHDAAGGAARLAARLFPGAGAAIVLAGPVEEHRAGDAGRATQATRFARHVMDAGAPAAEAARGGGRLAGVPLRAADGAVLGALAVASPDALDDEALDLLADLGRAAAADLALADAARALDELLDHTGDMACAVGGDGRLARTNAAWRAALGTADAPGLPLAELLAPEHRVPAARLLERLSAGGPAEDVELVLLAADGSRVVARGRATARPDRGRGAGMRLALRNLTAERHAQDMRARLAATLDASSDVCFMATAHGDLIYLNDAGRVLLGLAPDAPLAQHRLADLWAGDDAGRWTRDMLPAAQSRGLWDGEAELNACDGERVPVSAVVVAHPSAIPGAPPFFFSAVLRDLRERRRAEAEMALLHRVPHLVSTADDVDEALLTALDAMCAAAGWDYGEVWLPESPNDADVAAALRQGPAWCSPRDPGLVAYARAARPTRLRRGEGAVGRAWASGRAEWVADVGQVPEFSRGGAVAAAGLHGAAAVPVRVGDETVAVLCFLSRRPRDAESARLDLLAAVCAQMGAAVLRKRAESRLAAEREFLAALLESATDGIVACDAEGRVTVFNRAMRALLGSEADRPADAHREALAVVRDEAGRAFDPARTPLRRALAGETLRGVELQVQAPGRPPRTLVSAGQPIRVGHEIIGAVAAFRDVTEERRAKELKDQLISTASHELRTPLAAVRGALEVLETLGGEDAKSGELLEMARRNTGHIMRLVDDLLDAERVESGAIPMEPDVHGAAELLRRAAESVHLLAERAGVTIDVARPDLAVWADADRVAQVLVNLLANAVKFSRPGTRVAAGAAAACEDWVTFWVADEGRGVPADKLEAIFNRFEQVDAADAREKGGAGLGLAIARAIVEQHGGRIWCESTLGEGSTFRFTVPTVAWSLKQLEAGLA